MVLSFCPHSVFISHIFTLNLFKLISIIFSFRSWLCVVGGGDGAESHDLLLAGCWWRRQLAAGR